MSSHKEQKEHNELKELEVIKNRGGRFFGEFKQFIMRGNVIDLAVGVIIGGAFQKIINSLVNDLIMPVVGLFTGGIDFSNRFIALDGGDYATIEAAKAAGAATFNYGSFLTTTLDFLIMAFVIFLLIKGINKLTSIHIGKKTEEKEEQAPTTKICPYCLHEIPFAATRCAHCTSQLPGEDAPVAEAETEATAE